VGSTSEETTEAGLNPRDLREDWRGWEEEEGEGSKG